ncbi:two-component sensor histidine kinase [Paenibacillus sp. 598K]|uniref:cache domain-containing sensor histidine kinase n=1 Tax=Paenibacillus sp. 598K TaxID=1117987 RepID=UPI000FFA1309|nr:sensor histidine kinase [Paenibacillus sp. 598K]GBF77656.1 two-component sensor histidine kinase [Paenibacillus sp. 598K]
MKLLGRFQSLRTQLIISFMVTSLLVLMAASYYIYSYMQEMIRDQNERFLYQQFQQLDHNVHSLISDVDRLSSLFLRDDEIQDLLVNLSEKSELEFLDYKNSLHARIATFIDNYSYVHSIYLTAENQGVVGGTGMTTLVHSDAEWKARFFTSEAYLRSQAEYPKLIVEGAFHESFYNPYKTAETGGTVISMMRGTRAIYDPRVSATLIFNVDERYFASIYASSLDGEDGDMYIVNDQGIIVSSSRPERVGTSSPYVPQAGGEPGDYGSYDATAEPTPVQVVYYKLEDAGWYAMKEVPLSLFREQVYSIQRMMILVFLISLCVIFATTYVWLKRMTRPLLDLSDKMKNMGRGELGVTFDEVPDNELGTVIRRFNEMSLGIVDLVDKNNAMQEQKRELEIEALQYQINPHFLYNTLNMIRWMASMIKADNIVSSIVALGNILRPAFTSKDAMCTLADELKYLENYVKIINWRFNNSVEFVLEVASEHLNAQVPRFILQPLVENAISAAKQGEEYAIRIVIRTESDDEELRIHVIDSGAGLSREKLAELNRQLEAGERRSEGEAGGTPADGSQAASGSGEAGAGAHGGADARRGPSAAERSGSGSASQHEGASGGPRSSAGGGTGIGLHNVNKRIRLYFGDAYGLRFEPRERGAEVVVRLPSTQKQGPSQH